MSTYRVAILVLILVLAGCSGTGGLPTGTTTAVDTALPSATPTSTDVSERPSGTLDVHFINVGQSVSTLIVAPSGETMLIDTGDFNDDGEYVLQYLQRHDITRIARHRCEPIHSRNASKSAEPPS